MTFEELAVAADIQQGTKALLLKARAKLLDGPRAPWEMLYHAELHLERKFDRDFKDVFAVPGGGTR